MTKWKWDGKRGYSIVTFCAGCMKSLLTLEDAKKIDKAILNKGEFKQILNGIKNVATITFFITEDKEMLQLLNYRIVIYPFVLIVSQRLENQNFRKRLNEI